MLSTENLEWLEDGTKKYGQDNDRMEMWQSYARHYMNTDETTVYVAFTWVDGVLSAGGRQKSEEDNGKGISGICRKV